MAEVLSQDEIDALLNSVSKDKDEDASPSAGSPIAPVMDDKDSTFLYDFKHPNRVSKDQLRNLRTIHETFSRMLATYLTTLLRTIVDVNLLSIDQVTFLEFTMAMSNPGCIWVFELQNYEGRGIVEVSPDLMLLTIERLFGGEGKQVDENRPLSIIEQNVAGKIVDRILQIYDEAWFKATPIETQMVRFELNPQFAQIAPASETAVVHFLEINVRNTTFPMNICFPYYVLDPIIQKLSADNWLGVTLKPKSDRDVDNARSVLKSSNVDLAVELGKAKLTMYELMGVEEGDILMLDKTVDAPLSVYVGGRPRFMGRPGMSGKKMAIEIESIIDPRDYEYDINEYDVNSTSRKSPQRGSMNMEANK